MAYIGIHVLRYLKEELAWATDEWLGVISKVMLFKQLYDCKKIKNNHFKLNNIVCVAMWSLVMYSNCFVI